jgi:hypothetical protein
MAGLATTFGPVFIQDQSASGKRDSSAQRRTTQNRLQARNEDQHDEIARLPRADLVKAANVSTLFMLPGIMHGILFAVVRVF